MSNCLITVDQEYVNCLLSLIIRHHAYAYRDIFMKDVVGVVNPRLNKEDIPVLSNVIFYLNYWDEDFDCNEIHKAKELVMRIIGFTEDAVCDEEVLNTLLTEWGYVYLNEIGTIYIEEE